MKKKQIVRQKFRDDTFLRDGHCCCFCDVTIDLDAHHITDRTLMPNGGYVKENGITVCQQHHLDAEQFHISGGTTWVDNMHPDDLYEKINSSIEQAIIKSDKL
jgi:5-methylcytosine-specific restriction endonuclease McrA